VLRFPTASLKEPAATVTTPVPPDEPEAVYVTWYEVPLPVKFDSVPSVAERSLIAKVVDALLSVKEMVDAPPAETDDGEAVSVDTVGGVSSTVTAALFDAVVNDPPSRVVVTFTR